MHQEGRVENRAVYVAIGVDLEGQKDVLGLWASANEGARFWLSVLTDLKNRVVKDMRIVCVDGLKGFPQAIETVFPLAQMADFDAVVVAHTTTSPCWNAPTSSIGGWASLRAPRPTEPGRAGTLPAAASQAARTLPTAPHGHHNLVA